MAAYVAGDRRAFAELFRRLAPRVHGFFQRTFGRPSLADDLLQITFLKIHQARGQYRRELPLRPWLFAIAARVRLDEFRRSRHLPGDIDEEALAQLEEAAATAEERSSNHDVIANVRAALDELPESQRVIIHLHRYEEMTFAEIARALGTTEGAVKLRAFRAYQRLRRRLQPLAVGRVA